MLSRIISGRGAGLNLCLVSNKENLRPTTGRVKEAFFDIIQFFIHGSVFLDAFAGTGQIGIEAASRGAEHVVFIEKSKTSIKIIENNIEKYKKSNLLNVNVLKHGTSKNDHKPVKFEVMHSNVFDLLLELKRKPNIIFADPPFDSCLALKFLDRFSEIICKNGVLVLETSSKNKLPNELNGLFLKKVYRYGNVSLNLYLKI
jgi:16S rRNA (guanine(966)-N(2))-methyltransferase RsmD